LNVKDTSLFGSFIKTDLQKFTTIHQSA